MYLWSDGNQVELSQLSTLIEYISKFYKIFWLINIYKDIKVLISKFWNRFINELNIS